MNNQHGLMRGKSLGADNFSLVGIFAAIELGHFNLHCFYLPLGANTIIVQCVQNFENRAMSWQYFSHLCYCQMLVSIFNKESCSMIIVYIFHWALCTCYCCFYWQHFVWNFVTCYKFSGPKSKCLNASSKISCRSVELGQ